VAAALIISGVLFLTRGSPGHTAAGTASTSAVGVASTSPAGRASTAGQARSSAPEAAPGTGLVIPAAFAGSWSGTATMSAIGVPGVGLKNPIQFSFTAGARTAHENDQSCVNTLTLTAVTATALTFTEPGTVNCVAGTDTFTRHGTDLAYRWTDNVEQNTATLRNVAASG
jgi:hypothetical protein